MSMLESLHPKMTLIILIINCTLFLGVFSLVRYVQKNYDKWTKTVEKKINDKLDEIKKELPSIIQESIGGSVNRSYGF